MTDHYWWAEEVPYDAEEHRGRTFCWRPVLQLEGYVSPLDIWFATEEDCLTFIRHEVIGATMEDE